MPDMTLVEFVQFLANGGDVPMLILIAYFMWKLDKRMERLSVRISTYMRMMDQRVSTFMGMPDDDEHR